MNRYFYIVLISIFVVVLSVGMYTYNLNSTNSIEKKDEVTVDKPVTKKEEVSVLSGKKFTWVKSELNLNKETILPAKKEAYNIFFEEQKKVRIVTDCNSGFGEYEIEGNKITFGNITSTEKYCPDSQEGIFYNELISAQTFNLDNNGNLVFDIKIGKIYLKEVLLQQVNGVSTNSLLGKEYKWLRTELKNNKIVLPKSQGKFKLMFSEDLKFTAMTDCNTNGGTYTLIDNNLKFSETVATRMYCANSQEESFIMDLQKTSTIEFLPDETLILNLSDNSGRMYFR